MSCGALEIPHCRENIFAVADLFVHKAEREWLKCWVMSKIPYKDQVGIPNPPTFFYTPWSCFPNIRATSLYLIIFSGKSTIIYLPIDALLST